MLGRVVLVLGCLSPLPVTGQYIVSAGPNVWLSQERSGVVQVEPVIAVSAGDPARMVAAAIGLRRPHAGDWQDHQTIFVYQSEDGGRSWTHRTVETLPESWTAGDPWLAWQRGGEVVLSAIAGEAIRRGNPPARARLFLSLDGGRTWDRGGSTPFAGGSAEDHAVLAAGPGAESGLAYLVATHATMQSEGVDAASIEIPGLDAKLVPPLRPRLEHVNLGGAVVAPGGGLVVSYFSMSTAWDLWASRYDGAAGSWSVTRIRENILPVGFPSLAVDHSGGSFAGRIYSAWVESQDQMGMQVLVSWSDDEGTSWSSPTQAHTDNSRVGRTLPALSVASDGSVGIVWQDRRNAEGRECADLYGAISVDGARSFLPEVRISSDTACAGSYEENGAAASRFRLGGGDYQGLAAAGPGAFQAVWSDARTGRYQVWTAWLRVIPSR